MALPFLPDSEIKPMFQRLQHKGSEPLQHFTEYVPSTCIHGTTLGPSDWTIFQKPTVKTTMLRVGTMASTVQLLDVDSYPYSYLYSSCKEKPDLLP